MAKLVAIDNYNRETVADILVAENLTDHWAEFLANAANRETGADSDRFFVARPDDYRLSRGMADLV